MLKIPPYCRIATLFIFLYLTGNAVLAQNSAEPFSYKAHWDNALPLNREVSPESVLKEAELILKQAEADKNTVQYIKASVLAMSCTLAKEPEKAQAQLAHFEALSKKTIDVADIALLQSMAAELYLMYYKNNGYTINRRTEVFGPNKGNLEQWTKNAFSDTIQSLLKSSLQPSKLLQQTAIAKYRDLLDKGPNKRIEPTLYEFLAKRKIDLLTELKQVLQEPDFTASLEFLYLPAPLFATTKVDSTMGSAIDREIIVTFQEWLQFRLKTPAPLVLLNADFRRIEAFHDWLDNGWHSEGNRLENGLTTSGTAYLKALESLASKFSKNPQVSSVIASMASFYYMQSSNSELNNDNDSIRTSFKRKAYEICADGIARFPEGKDVEILKRLQDQIRQKQMNMSNSAVVKPRSTMAVALLASNMDKVELKVYKVNSTAIDYYLNTSNNWKGVSASSVLLEKRWIKLNQDSNFNSVKTIIPIKTRSYGIYEFTLSSNEIPNEQLLGRFVVSDLAYLSQNSNRTTFCVVDRVSGKPVSDVQVKAFTTHWNKTKNELVPYMEGKTDQNGQIEYVRSNNNYNYTVSFFEKGADKYLTTDHNSYRRYYPSSNSKKLNLKLFTDRSLYRPGQTVHFKGIAYRMNSEFQEVAANETFEVRLLDANRKQVSIRTLRSNEFGSITDSFVLPVDGLNGTFCLQSSNSYAYIRVEAYKRPTFEVTLEGPKTELHFGQTISMQGKVMAYAGFPVSNATVAFKVIRRMHYRMRVQANQVLITNGTLQTSADGTFELRFPANRNSVLHGEQYYSYQVTAEVTDQKGETQKGSKDVSVGDRSLYILSKIFDQSLQDKAKAMELDVQLSTLNNKKVEGNIGYELFRLEQSEEYLDQNKDKTLNECKGTSVRSGSFQTKDGAFKLDLSGEPSGPYRIDFYALDSRQDTVRLTNTFILYDDNDKRPPVKMRTWLLAPKRVCSVGENAVVKFGSSSNEVHVLYQVMKVDSVLESKWMTLSNEIRTLEIPYLSSYGDQVDVLFTYVKDEQLFYKWITLAKKREKRTLSPRLTVFRDKLQPGEKAEWTVHIPETQEKNRQAELLIGMYDASLDAIHPHSWYFEPILPTYIAVAPWTSTINKSFEHYLQEKLPDYDPQVKSYFKLDWMGLNLGDGNRRNTMNVSVARVRGIGTLDLADHKVIIEEKPVFSMGRVGSLLQETVVTRPSKPASQVVSIRGDFNETAFFFPKLRTDQQGNIRFSFTVPESITRWNVMMLAHTKNLHYGRADTTLVTQKDLMVQLNLPRFVRRSDKLLLRATVVNLTDAAQQATVRLELTNPENAGAISLKDSMLRTVELAARETKYVEWTLTEFAPYELVVCKVVANSESFSDGEQRYLPVLPDQVLLTESVPMTVRVNQTKTFTMDNLLKKDARINSQSMTVEFSPNPAWAAVQALPSLSVPEQPNAFDLFTAYYVNTLAAHIANSNPKLAAVFEQWKATGGQEALRSSLEKNQELKSMVLEETPWVLAAQNESQQKRQIALLFDRNRQKQQNEQYWDKLLKLQMTSGGFSWFEGMLENRYLTQYILLNRARLNALIQLDTTSVDNALIKAIAFIDNELVHDFVNLTRSNPSYKSSRNISDLQWFYLHVRSEYPQVPIPDFAQEAVTYYRAQAETYWLDASLYGKAATALIASRNKNSKLAEKILASLKENAVKSEEMGMYWARNKPGYFWNQRPVTVQTMLMEAFAELGKNTEDLDEMKMWLLRQKQTQRWDSPLSTVDAVYALLQNGSDWISSENEVSIQLGSKPLHMEQKEAGTGYFKQTIAGKDVEPSMGKANVTLKGKSGFGWGALYWQFYQNQNEVKQSGNALTVSKSLFVEVVHPTGKAMKPIDQVVLKKGDKVITRLVVTVDRDMEYVALKDLRAACLEPVNQRSGCVWKEGVAYYQTIKDASTQFFFSSLPKGSYVFEYETWVTNAGVFTSGITTLQCQYAPEFTAHSGGEKIEVSEK